MDGTSELPLAAVVLLRANTGDSAERALLLIGEWVDFAVANRVFDSRGLVPADFVDLALAVERTLHQHHPHALDGVPLLVLLVPNGGARFARIVLGDLVAEVLVVPDVDGGVVHLGDPDVVLGRVRAFEEATVRRLLDGTRRRVTPLDAASALPSYRLFRQRSAPSDPPGSDRRSEERRVGK